MLPVVLRNSWRKYDNNVRSEIVGTYNPPTPILLTIGYVFTTSVLDYHSVQYICWYLITVTFNLGWVFAFREQMSILHVFQPSSWLQGAICIFTSFSLLKLEVHIIVTSSSLHSIWIIVNLQLYHLKRKKGKMVMRYDVYSHYT